MIHSRDYLPDYFVDNSYDVHTYLRLIDLVSNYDKMTSDDFINILNPEKCPNKLLPLLASFLGYEYDYNETYEKNRTILKSYKSMIRNKGSMTGIKLATSTAIAMESNKSLADTQKLYDIGYYDKYYQCNKCKYVAYTKFDICPSCLSEDISKHDNESLVIVMAYPKYSAKLYDLVEAVRPVGLGCIAYNGTIQRKQETLAIYDYIRLQNSYLNRGNAEVGGKDAVSGFTEILKEDSINHKYCNYCGFSYFDPDAYTTSQKYYIDDMTVYNGNIYKCVSDILYVYDDYGNEDTVIGISEDFIQAYNNVVDDEDKLQSSIPDTENSNYWEYIRTVNTCPRCGSENYISAENDSNPRLLYRLYTTNKQLESASRMIEKSLEVNKLITDDINYKGRYSSTATYSEGDIVSVMIIYGNELMKPSEIKYFIKNDVPFPSGNISPIETDEHGLLIGNLYWNNYYKDFNPDNYIGIILRIHTTYNFDTDEPTTIDENYRKFNTNNTSSFLIGVKPYINYTIDQTQKEICEYDLSTLLERIASANHTDVSLLQAGYSSSHQFDADGKNITFSLTATDSGGEEHGYSKKFKLLTATVRSIHEFKNSATLPQPVTDDYGLYDYTLYDISDSENPVDNETKLDFHMGNDNIDTTEIETSGTFINFGNYINVCRNCNEIFVEDSVTLCTNCGGVKFYGDGLQSTQVFPTILRGSYVIDLHYQGQPGEN